MQAEGPSGAIIYGRLSRLKPGSLSVDSQIERSQDWSAREGWPVLAVHRDDGISASRNNGRTKARDGWADTMADIYDHPGCVLLLWEMSRATRDRGVWAALFAACTDTGAWVGIDGRLHDPNDPDDAFILDLKASLGVRESAVIKKRVKETTVKQAALGRPHGRLPYGYRREYSAESGAFLRQVPDPQQAPIVREIAGRVLSGETLYSVVKDLNERRVPWRHWSADTAPEGVRNGAWYTSQVRRMLTSPTYAGLRTHHGQVSDGDWEPLIPHEQHRQLVDLLTAEGRSKVDSFEVRHLLSGIAVAECGGVCRLLRNRGVPSYYCARDFCVSRAEDPVDRYVTEYVLAFCSRPDVRAQLGDPQDESLAAARRELRDLEAYLQSYRDAAAQRRLSVDSLVAVEQQIVPQIDEARRRAEPAHVSRSLLDLVDADDVTAMWHDPQFGLVRQRQVVRAVVRVVIHRTPYRDRRFDADSIELVPLDGAGRLASGDEPQ